MSDESLPASASTRSVRGLLGSKSLWLAAIITLAGAFWWLYSATMSPAAPPTRSVSSLAQADSIDGRAVESTARAANAAPAAFRYGASFLGAFLIAYFLKKVIRSVLLIAALLIGAILTLKYFGILNYDWSNAQHQVEQGVGFAREEGEKYRTHLMANLPSGLATGVGAILGARRG